MINNILSLLLSSEMLLHTFPFHYTTMRRGYGLLIGWVTCLFLFMASGYVAADNPMPCCIVKYIEPGELPDPQMLAMIHLSSPTTCEQGNICKGYVAPDGVQRNTAYKEVCLNGYNTVAFLIAAIQQLGGAATEAETSLLRSLIKTQEEYSIHRISALGK